MTSRIFIVFKKRFFHLFTFLCQDSKLQFKFYSQIFSALIAVFPICYLSKSLIEVLNTFAVNSCSYYSTVSITPNLCNSNDPFGFRQTNAKLFAVFTTQISSQTQTLMLFFKVEFYSPSFFFDLFRIQMTIVVVLSYGQLIEGRKQPFSIIDRRLPPCKG